MPLSRQRQCYYNCPPVPANGPPQSQSPLAARIAAYLDAISLPHPDDGKPVPPRHVDRPITCCRGARRKGVL